jgi:hypothetical protein
MIAPMTPSKLLLSAALAVGFLAMSQPAAAQGPGGAPILDAPPAGTPDFNGKWINASPMIALKTADGKAPPLNAKGKALLAKHLANPKSDNINQCQLQGIPRMLYSSYPFLILQYQGHVDFAHETNREFRIVRFNDKFKFTDKLDPDVDPIWMGHNSAKWDGKTLVIDSIRFNDKTWLDYHGLPHGEQLKVQERYNLAADGQSINGTVLIEDPEYYTKPWTTAFVLKKQPGMDLREFVCEEDHKM